MQRFKPYAWMLLFLLGSCTCFSVSVYRLVNLLYGTAEAAAAVSYPEGFIPLATPCRALDTRLKPHTALAAQETRDVRLIDVCGVPVTAASVYANVTVVPVDGKPFGFLTMWPFGLERPVVSLLNSLDGQIRNNSTILDVKNDGRVNMYVTEPAHVIIDVSGYFTRGTELRFPSLCRSVIEDAYGRMIETYQECKGR